MTQNASGKIYMPSTEGVLLSAKCFEGELVRKKIFEVDKTFFLKGALGSRSQLLNNGNSRKQKGKNDEQNNFKVFPKD